MLLRQSENELQELGESQIQHPNESRYEEHHNENNDSVVQDLALGRPLELFELRDELSEVASDSSLFLGFRHFSTLLRLLRFSVQGVLAAETAILVHLKSVGIVLLVFDCVVVALLAFGAGKCDFDSHRISSR